jgi:hypothetical protein
MRVTSACELEIFLVSGRHTLFVCRNLNWSSFPTVLSVACGVSSCGLVLLSF